MDKIQTYGRDPEKDGCFIIGQDDDNAYDESGYVAWIDKQGRAHLSSYCHCSCYGTWEEGAATDTFVGTIDELVKMSKKNRDPDMPEREANKADYDYDHLLAVYAQIIAWDKGGRVV